MSDPHTGSALSSSDERLLTTDEAADILRTPAATLRYWRHIGAGPRGFRLGRRVLYRYDDLRAWVDAQHDADPQTHTAGGPPGPRRA